MGSFDIRCFLLIHKSAKTSKITTIFFFFNSAYLFFLTPVESKSMYNVLIIDDIDYVSRDFYKLNCLVLQNTLCDDGI